MHQYFQNWHKAGLFQKLWQAGLAEYDGMHAIAWQLGSADGAMGKAPLATECVGQNLMDRQSANAGRCPCIFPPSIAVSGANLHDSKLLDRTWHRSCPNALRLQDGKNDQYLCSGRLGHARLPS